MNFSLWVRVDKQRFVIDASQERETDLGRLVNHCDRRFANLKPKYVYDSTGKLRIVLHATKDIAVGEQYLYDYAAVC